jgi:HAD superfamily hydrolase (TIGR01549 family)
MRARRDFDWVFFDCFNTLIDDFDEAGDESGLCTLPKLAVTEGYFASEKEFVAHYRRHRSDVARPHAEVHFDERLRRTLASSQRVGSPEQIAQTVAAWLRHWDEAYLRLLRPTPGAAAALRRWAENKKLGVISNFFLPEYPARYFRHFGFDDHFQFILDSANFGIRKPHAKIFHQAMKLAGVDPAQANRILFIGDRVDLDILPARDCGMQVLHFNRSKSRPNVAPTPPGIPVIYDWSEFA